METAPAAIVHEAPQTQPAHPDPDHHPTIPTSHDDIFNWESGEYSEERRIIFGLDRLFVCGTVLLTSLIAILGAALITSRTKSYDIIQEAYPADPQRWPEIARCLYFGGGVFAVWSLTLLLIELLPSFVWWCRRMQGRDVPGSIIAFYTHIFAATWEVGATTLALVAANLAGTLFPPPLQIDLDPKAIAENLPPKQIATILEEAERDPSTRDERTLEALRLWLKSATKPAKQSRYVDASAHLVSIVKNLSTMSWQVRLVRLFYLLSVYYSLAFAVKLFMSYIAVAFHKRTLQQRLATNRQAIAITRRLRQRLLPERTKVTHAQLGAALFDLLCPRGMQYIGMGELREFLPPDLASLYMELIDLDGNGDISRDEFVSAVHSFYSERDHLSGSVSGNSRIIDQLSSFLYTGVYFVTILWALVLLDETISNTLKMVGGALLSLTFVFGGTAASAFQSALFILLSHPFDVGDCVVINGADYRVKELGLWACTFIGPGNATVYMTNNSIRSARISNARRSGRQSESFVIRLSAETTDGQLDQVEQEMSRWVAENDRDFVGGSFMLTRVQVMDKERLEVEMELTHKSNFQDGGVRKKRNRAFFFHLRATLGRLGISLAKQLH